MQQFGVWEEAGGGLEHHVALLVFVGHLDPRVVVVLANVHGRHLARTDGVEKPLPCHTAFACAGQLQTGQGVALALGKRAVLKEIDQHDVIERLDALNLALLHRVALEQRGPKVQGMPLDVSVACVRRRAGAHHWDWRVRRAQLNVLPRHHPDTHRQRLVRRQKAASLGKSGTPADWLFGHALHELDVLEGLGVQQQSRGVADAAVVSVSLPGLGVLDGLGVQQECRGVAGAAVVCVCLHGLGLLVGPRVHQQSGSVASAVAACTSVCACGRAACVHIEVQHQIPPALKVPRQQCLARVTEFSAAIRENVLTQRHARRAAAHAAMHTHEAEPWNAVALELGGARLLR